MDSRQSPFARNSQPASHPVSHSNSPSRSHSLSHSHASSYGRPTSYPPTSSAPPPPGQQHQYPPPQPPSSYGPDSSSRTFDGPPSFYPPSSVASRVYAPDQPALPPAPPLHPAAHGRHHSTSSIPPGQTPLSRSMPPPQSPTQQPGQQTTSAAAAAAAAAAASGPRNPFSLPTPLHAPGGPSPGGPSRQPTGSYMGGRELPALGSRASVSGGSSMSISAMLGARDSQASTVQGPPSHTNHPPTQSHYGPGSAPPAAAQGPNYATPAIQASPRLHHNGPPGSQQQPPPQQSEYPPQYRRSNTPDPSRPYDPSRSTHASPRAAYTPDIPRYGTPQAYHPRSIPTNDGRDASRTSMPQPPTQAPSMPPARPSSNPKNFPMSRPGEEPRRVAEDQYARRDEPNRPPINMEYNSERAPLKPAGYDDRFRYERERLQPPPQQSQQDQAARHRAALTGRERTLSGGGDGRMSHGGPPPPPQQTSGPDYGPSRGMPPQYARAPEPGHWQRQSYEHPRSQYEQTNHQRGPEYPPSSAPQYPPPHASSSAHPNAHAPDRYVPPHSKPPVTAMHGNYDRSPERPQINVMQAQGPHNLSSQQMHPQQPPRPRRMEDGPPPPSVAYGTAHISAPKQAPTSNPSMPYDPSSVARSKTSDEPALTAPPLQRSNSLLAIQEINRSKGRSSPLPQAVQGAQPQMPGPPAEHGIKSEFGRMYFGIGIESLNSVGLSSPGTSAATPFGGPGAPRRDDDHSTELEPKSKGRKKKARDEPAGEDDSSSRGAGGSKAKRVKTHQHQHHHHHHHHHHHFHGDGAPGPHPGGQTGAQGKTPAHSPTMKDLPAPGPFHHHHHARPGPSALPGGSVGSATKLASSPVVIPPQKKLTVSSQPVLDSVAHKPRYFLGDVLYEPIISTDRLVPNHASSRGYKTTPNPLPWSMIKGKENCTMTVKVPKVHLMSGPREEITSRRAVWGTDVYTDDSDVVAACIHAGWIRGEWPEDVDVEMLELDQGVGSEDQTSDGASATAATVAGASATDSTTVRRRKEKERLEHERDESYEADYLSKPPRTGPVPIKANHDLQVTLLILPTLQRYASSTRFGMQSREFGRNHDGLSFMITAIRWVVNGGAPQSRLRGKARRERMRMALGFAAATVASENGGRGQDAPGERTEQNGIGRHSINLAVMAA